MLEQSMQTKRPSSHCHKGHKTDQPGGCNSQIQKQNQGKVEKISEDRLDLIPSPSPSVKIQIIGGKV